MFCKCAKSTGEFHGWECSVSGSSCMFILPDSKLCAELYGEGPEAERNKCEDCKCFYLEENKRCCTREPLALIGKEIVKTKYIEEDTVCCGAFDGRSE